MKIVCRMQITKVGGRTSHIRVLGSVAVMVMFVMATFTTVMVVV